jgi:3-isopropylmalate dehydrogenase
MAARLETGIAAVLKEGRVRTYDLGGEASTMDMARAVMEKMGN